VVVVDANIALAWVLQDTPANHLYSARVAAAAMSGERLIAPMVFPAEISYALLKKGRSGRWGEALIAEYAEVIGNFRVQLHAIEESIAAQVRFAVRHHVQGYDALYLALAMHSGAPLATLDGGLKTAARAAGLRLFSA
jgi:predicted nucleic acid-binding protein